MINLKINRSVKTQLQKYIGVVRSGLLAPDIR